MVIFSWIANGLKESIHFLNPFFFFILPLVSSLLFTALYLKAKNAVGYLAQALPDWGMVGTLWGFLISQPSGEYAFISVAVYTTFLAVIGHSILCTVGGVHALWKFLKKRKLKEAEDA
jgi:hypothetical protein